MHAEIKVWPDILNPAEDMSRNFEQMNWDNRIHRLRTQVAETV